MMRTLLGDSFPKRPITCTVLLLTMMIAMASLCLAVGIFSDGFDVATSGWLVYEDADQHYAYEPWYVCGGDSR